MDPIQPVRVRAVEGTTSTEREDALAVEEPLEIRLREIGAREVRTFAITMRTPGQDEALAAGLLFAEGVLRAREDLIEMSRPSDPRIDPELAANVIVATLSPAASARAEELRRGTGDGFRRAESAGKRPSRTSSHPTVRRSQPEWSFRTPERSMRFPDCLRERQSIFSRTGGLHAGALFDPKGEIAAIAEDIGRHNATDKLVGGAYLADGLPLPDRILMVSGRAGFEIVQKAFAAGIPVVASVSAPSSLAVELAETGGVTLVGFLRGERFNVYTHPSVIA